MLFIIPCLFYFSPSHDPLLFISKFLFNPDPRVLGLISREFLYERLVTFVSPGMGAVLQTFFFISVLIIELLPTFGYPIKPTLHR